MSYGAEILPLSELFFKEEVTYNEEAEEVLKQEHVPEVLRAFLEETENLQDFVAEEIKKAIKNVQKKTGQKGKNLFMPIRAAATGQTHGPELPSALELLGKEKVQKRISSLLNNLSQ